MARQRSHSWSRRHSSRSIIATDRFVSARQRGMDGIKASRAAEIAELAIAREEGEAEEEEDNAEEEDVEVARMVARASAKLPRKML